MKPKTWQGIAAWLLLLVGVGVAGWFAGANVIAHEAQQPETVVVQPPPPAAGGLGAGVLVPRGGLSPFGHPAGLPGRQVLVGRVVEAGESTLTVEWAGGRTELRFAQGSDLLLRLRVDSDASIEPGGAIALLVDRDGEELVARSGILLPEENRPRTVPGLTRRDLTPESTP